MTDDCVTLYVYIMSINSEYSNILCDCDFVISWDENVEENHINIDDMEVNLDDFHNYIKSNYLK